MTCPALLPDELPSLQTFPTCHFGNRDYFLDILWADIA
jgi:hypothetical protein